MDLKSKINNNDNIVIPYDAAKLIAEYKEKLERAQEITKESNYKRFGFFYVESWEKRRVFKTTARIQR